MDCTAFPKILHFKVKQVPAQQLLRWAEWFSAYSFEVKHIKGKNNILPDILSRPIHILNTAPLPVFCMMGQASASSHPSSPPLPPELQHLIQTKTIHSRAHDLCLKYLSLAIQKEGPNALGSLIIHPDYPYHTLFVFDPHQCFSSELYYFLYYLLEQYSIG